MNTQQTEIIRLIKIGRNTVSELAINLGETQHKVMQELSQLSTLGFVESNMSKTQWFV